MARSRNDNRRTIRNSNKKSDNNGVQVVRYQPSVFGFPDRLVVKLRYADYISLVCTSGALAKQVMRMNSIYDPDLSSTGHQPLYHDTYAGIYDHYAVISSVAHIEIVNPSAVALLVGCVNDDDSSSSTTFQTLMEQSHGQTAELTGITGSRSHVAMTAKFDAKQTLGIDPFRSEQYKTSTGANPAEDSNLVIWGLPFDGSTTLTFNLRVTVEYTVLFTELTTPTQS